MLKKFISKHEYERTIKLLALTRRNYDIKTYLLMKNILTVGMMTDYFQNLKDMSRWIGYHSLLERNEHLVRQKRAYINIVKNNYLDEEEYTTFFGIPCEIVLHQPFTKVIDAMYEYWWSPE